MFINYHNFNKYNFNYFSFIIIVLKNCYNYLKITKKNLLYNYKKRDIKLIYFLS